MPRINDLAGSSGVPRRTLEPCWRPDVIERTISPLTGDAGPISRSARSRAVSLLLGHVIASRFLKAYDLDRDTVRDR